MTDEPFLIGEAMTGGYGGADILKGCAISAYKGADARLRSASEQGAAR